MPLLFTIDTFSERQYRVCCDKHPGAFEQFFEIPVLEFIALSQPMYQSEVMKRAEDLVAQGCPECRLDKVLPPTRWPDGAEL